MRSFKPFGHVRFSKPTVSFGNNPQKTRFFVVTITVLAVLISGVIANQGISRADSQVSFAYYIDAPLVQNSYIWSNNPNETSTHLASFNNLAPRNAYSDGDACTFDSYTGATFTLNQTFGCFPWNGSAWGGATTLSSNPTTGGWNGMPLDGTSTFGAVTGSGVTINFESPQRYLGIWWSAGNRGNIIEFYDGTTLVGSTSADEVVTRLEGQTSIITSSSGQVYAKDLYRGHPSAYRNAGSTSTDYSDVSEVSSVDSLSSTANFSANGNAESAGEFFAYLHFFADNGQTFNKVVLRGDGFEFDNIVVSDEVGLLSSLNPRLVLQGTVLLPKEVQFNPNAAQGGVGEMNPQFSATSANLNWNAFYNSLPWLMFAGWNTEPDGSGTSYEQTAEFPFANNTTLYAQWDLDPYWYTEFRFFLDNDGNYIPSITPSITVSAGEDLVLPEPSPRSGLRFAGWTYQYWDENENYVTGIIGNPGDHITPSAYLPIIYSNALYETWVPDNIPNPVIGASSSTIPVDPRVSVETIPSLPVDTESFNLCVSEVTDATGIHEVSESDLSFSTLTSANATGPINISAGSPITASGSRFVRITVSDTSFGDCQYGNSITIEFKPLQLGAGNTVTVPIGRQ